MKERYVFYIYFTSMWFYRQFILNACSIVDRKTSKQFSQRDSSMNSKFNCYRIKIFQCQHRHASICIQKKRYSSVFFRNCLFNKYGIAGLNRRAGYAIMQSVFRSVPQTVYNVYADLQSGLRVKENSFTPFRGVFLQVSNGDCKQFSSVPPGKSLSDCYKRSNIMKSKF